MVEARTGKGVAMKTTLSITQEQHAQLAAHLFPGDGKESVAFALCGRRYGKAEQGLLVRKIIPISDNDCVIRTPENVTWPTFMLPELITKAEKNGMAILKIHSHPGGYKFFSKCDDKSDREYFSCLSTWFNDASVHASAIMLPDGEIMGRTFDLLGNFHPITTVKLVGDDLTFWHSCPPLGSVPEHGMRIAQAFGEGTYQQLRQLKIAVVGCSGTGSLVIEQLSRNCVGSLVLVDPDRIEMKNLNRIPQAKRKDAESKAFKVEIIAQAIDAMGLGTSVEIFATSLYDPAAVKAVAACDIVFGCMDSIDGRHLLNRLASFYLLPYIDIGVRLEADGEGGIEQICGSVHYLRPGGSSLFSRGLYTIEQAHSAALYNTDPNAYADQIKDGYISGVHEEKPAVISVNMFYSSLAINELLARLKPYRLDSNAEYNRHTISLSHGIYEHEGHPDPCALLSKHVGRGDVAPLLGMPVLTAKAEGSGA